MKEISSDFYVVARESGAENPDIPTWANETENIMQLDPDLKPDIKKVDIKELPASFQLLNVFTKEECQTFIKESEKLGYLKDAAVSLPRSVRHNDNLTWVIDQSTHNIIWDRCQEFLPDKSSLFYGKRVLGINKRFRFYKYAKGDFFKFHTDGSWPGSSVENRELITDFYRDRYSQMTFLVFLSEDFEGGATQFLVDKNDPTRPAKDTKNANIINIRTPMGGVLCFPHGLHPLHCLHQSQEIVSGIKYIIRSDLLFGV